ncbi:MAG: GIY-YIG nuclease family protein [Clostridia bacterium]
MYLLRCADGTLYCGVALDLSRRVAMHQSGRGARYTRGRRPLELVWVEDGLSQRAALLREREIKRWPRVRKESLIARWTNAGPGPEPSTSSPPP